MSNKVFYLQMPLSRDDIESMEIDDIIYLSGRMVTLRDLAHQRIEQLAEEGHTDHIPFALRDAVVFHGSLVVIGAEKGGYRVVSVGATSSSRFSPRVRTLLDAMGPRVLVGKGSLTEEAIAHLQHYTAVYLQAVGGCAALYASQARTVIGHHWAEFGMVDSVWELEVEHFGPLTVAIDCRGNSSYHRLRRDILKKNLLQVYTDLGIDPESDFVWWPRAPAGSRQARDYAVSSEDV